MKIRLIGTAAEIRAEVERLDRQYGRNRVSMSEPYPAWREPPGTFRVYVEIAAPEPVTVPGPTDKPKVSRALTRETSDTAIETSSRDQQY